MTPEVTAIACHHVGELVNLYESSIHKSVNVTFESIIISSNKDIRFDRRFAKLPPHKSNVIIRADLKMPASKRNFGAECAQGKYLAFFDDDVEVTPTCLYEMKKYLDENKNVGMVYAKTLNMEHRNRFDEAGSYLTWTGFLWSRAEQHVEDKGQYDYPIPILAGKSAACMIRTSVFYEVGKFDEYFGILGEETDLSWRVWLAGYHVHFVPSAVAYHAFNTSFKPRPKHYTNTRVYFNGCRNYITMLIKNLGVKNLCLILPIHILIWFGASCAMILTGRIAPGLKILSGIWYVLRSWRRISLKRRAVQSKRIRDDRDIWPFIFSQPHGRYYVHRFWKYITSTLHG